MRVLAGLKALAAGAITLAIAAPVLAQAPPDPTSLRLLAAHNRERAMVGAPPLQWDPQLAAAAMSYGPALSALGGQLAHSPRASRPGQRENLWRGSRGHYSPEQMVETWTSEKRYFRPGIFPAVSSTGNWLDVSHYTQLIWPTTLRLGCAIYRDARWDFLICRYSPPGNVDGRPVIMPRLGGERG